jgi:hypothetical protein
MKKAKVSDELRPEYRREDLGQGVRGKYFESYRKSSNLVLLSPDVAKARREESMKKAKVSDELRPEYRREDLGQGVRGKYFESYRKSSNLVLLSPDVAKVFPTEEAVNEVLRSLIDLAQKSTGRTKR